MDLGEMLFARNFYLNGGRLNMNLEDCVFN